MKITLRLTREQAAQLQQAFAEHALDHLKVTKVELIEAPLQQPVINLVFQFNTNFAEFNQPGKLQEFLSNINKLTVLGHELIPTVVAPDSTIVTIMATIPDAFRILFLFAVKQLDHLGVESVTVHEYQEMRVFTRQDRPSDLEQKWYLIATLIDLVKQVYWAKWYFFTFIAWSILTFICSGIASNPDNGPFLWFLFLFAALMLIVLHYPDVKKAAIKKAQEEKGRQEAEAIRKARLAKREYEAEIDAQSRRLLESPTGLTPEQLLNEWAYLKLFRLIFQEADFPPEEPKNENKPPLAPPPGTD